MHELQHPLIQKSYIKQYDSLLDGLEISSDFQVLDIGSGLGFFKSLVIRRGAEYVGIEPERSSYEAACRIYGGSGYLNGFFPGDCPSVKFDVVLVLSCIDEVPNKMEFLSGLRDRLNPDTGVAYIAVRNSNFFIYRFKSARNMANRSERARITATDLSSHEWQELIEAAGLKICEKGKFWRPWLTGFSFVGLKNVIYKLLSMIVPCKYSYMLYYKVKV